MHLFHSVIFTQLTIIMIQCIHGSFRVSLRKQHKSPNYAYEMGILRSLLSIRQLQHSSVGYAISSEYAWLYGATETLQQTRFAGAFSLLIKRILTFYMRIFYQINSLNTHVNNSFSYSVWILCDKSLKLRHTQEYLIH